MTDSNEVPEIEGEWLGKFHQLSALLIIVRQWVQIPPGAVLFLLSLSLILSLNNVRLQVP